MNPDWSGTGTSFAAVPLKLWISFVVRHQAFGFRLPDPFATGVDRNAEGTGSDFDLLRYVPAHQWKTAQDFAAKSAGGRARWHGADGRLWSADAGSGLSRGRLRYARAAARNDACLSLSLPGGLFRLGGGPGLAACENPAITSPASHLRLRCALGFAG